MAEFMKVMNGAQKMCKYLHDNLRDFDWCACDTCQEEFPSTYKICRYSYRVLSLETLKAVETEVLQFLKDNPTPVYPTWLDWLRDNASKPIPKEIAEKLGVEPVKEEK